MNTSSTERFETESGETEASFAPESRSGRVQFGCTNRRRTTVLACARNAVGEVLRAPENEQCSFVEHCNEAARRSERNGAKSGDFKPFGAR